MTLKLPLWPLWKHVTIIKSASRCLLSNFLHDSFPPFSLSLSPLFYYLLLHPPFTHFLPKWRPPPFLLSFPFFSFLIYEFCYFFHLILCMVVWVWVHICWRFWRVRVWGFENNSILISYRFICDCVYDSIYCCKFISLFKGTYKHVKASNK